MCIRIYSIFPRIHRLFTRMSMVLKISFDAVRSQLQMEIPGLPIPTFLDTIESASDY